MPPTNVLHSLENLIVSFDDFLPFGLKSLCPHCGDMQATVNPRNNLAHCFGCKKNLNNIDLLMTLGYDFRTAVSILQR